PSAELPTVETAAEQISSMDVTQSAAPAMAEAAVAQPPVPVPAARPQPKPQPKPQPGKKILSESEVEARLQRELTEAVSVQKEVEKAVEAAAPAATSGRFTINDEVLDGILWDLEVGLLESDVALPVIEAIKANVKEQLLSLSVGGKRPE